VRLAVGADQGARWREDQRGIVIFLGGGFQFWDTAADQVGIGLGGDRGERVEGGGLFLRGRGGEQSLGVFGEVCGAVGGVEALRQDDQACACFGGLKNLAAGMGEVGGLIDACRLRWLVGWEEM
jgi:hypothetical protein